MMLESIYNDSVKGFIPTSFFFNREEELIYLEFVSAVTEDILSRGHISDRFVIFFSITVFY